MYVDFKGHLEKLLKSLRTKGFDQIKKPMRIELELDSEVLDYLMDYANANNISHSFVVECLITTFIQGLVPEKRFIAPRYKIENMSQFAQLIDVE